MTVEISELRKSFKQNDISIQVLKGLNARIQTGEIVAILGESGSGKSTMLSLLSGLDDPDSGTLTIDGTDFLQLSEAQKTNFRSKNIGIVFQQYHLMSHLTALENVMLPLEIAGVERAKPLAIELIDELGLSHRMNHLPSHLSGGECQRVAIARALVVNPKFLLADEPSGNLDVDTGKKVMDVFFQSVRRHQTTTLLVTHSLELAKKCDRILTLVDGQLKQL